MRGIPASAKLKALVRVFYWQREMQRWRTVCANVMCRLTESKSHLALLRIISKLFILQSHLYLLNAGAARLLKAQTAEHFTSVVAEVVNGSRASAVLQTSLCREGGAAL